MERDVWLALLLMLQIVGVAATAYLLMLRLLRTPKEAVRFWMLTLPDARNARETLYALHMRRELLGERQTVIVALTDAIEDADRRELARFCDSVPRMYCCGRDALPALIAALQNENKDSS